MEPVHLIYLCPAVAILALIYAYMKASWVKAQDEGTDRMKMIGGWIADGRDVSAILWNSTLGDGPVVANAPDLERFIRALMESDRVIGGAVRAQMLRAAQPGSGYGLGIGVDGDEWGDWFGHSGGFDGAAADYRYYSEDGSIILVLANGDLDTDWVMDEAAAIWFGQ